MTYTARNAVLKNTIVWQWVVMGVLSIWALLATAGWMNVPKYFQFNLAPKLPNEALVLNMYDADKTAVWQFGQYFLSIINTWPKNGEEDYLFRIRALKQMGIITNTFYKQLYADFQKRSGQLGGVNTLRGVTRFDSTPLTHPYKPTDVEPVLDSNEEPVLGEWYAWIVLDMKESINDREIRSQRLRYKVKIVRTFENVTDNDYGLAIDSFVEQPQRLVTP